MIILVVRVDSGIDLITNSSSGIFVCKTDHDIQTIKEIVSDILNSAGYTYDTCFEKPYIIDDTNIHSYIESVSGYQMHSEMGFSAIPEYNYNEVILDDGTKLSAVQYETMILMCLNESGRRAFQKRRSVERQIVKYKERMEQWKIYNKEKIDIIKGSVVLYSIDENTIPYKIWNAICETLNPEHAYRG